MPRHSVGIGEVAVSACEEDVLSILGLGSCVGVALYDPIAMVGGLLHVMLPSACGVPDADAALRYADTGIPEMIRRMEREGAVPTHLQAAIAGGANMFHFGPDSHIRVGEANVAAVEQTLREAGIPIVGADVGGASGRRISLSVRTGEVRVARTGQEPHVLANLGRRGALAEVRRRAAA